MTHDSVILHIRTNPRPLLLISGVLLVFSLNRLPAQWTKDPSVNTPVCFGNYYQSAPKMTSDGAGGAYITWSDNRGDGYHIYAQHMNSRGVPQWAVNGIAVSAGPAMQAEAVITADGSGGAIIVWKDQRAGPISNRIYAQKLNSAGSPQWAPEGIPVSTTWSTMHAILPDGKGGFIITWTDGRGTTYDIYAQHIDSSGAAQWTAGGVAICQAVWHQYFPAIVSDGDGGAIITWQDGRTSAPLLERHDVYAQRISSSGVVQWQTDGVPICTTDDNQDSPVLFGDGSGGAFIVWHDLHYSYMHLYAQRVDGSGQIRWHKDGVPVSLWSGYDAQATPALVSDGSGGIIIVFATLNGIWAQRMNTAGEHLWTPYDKLVCVTGGGVNNHVYTANGSGGAFIAWTDRRPLHGDTVTLYAQQINAAGDSIWKMNGMLIASGWGVKFYPQITSDGSGGAILSWLDAGHFDLVNYWPQNVYAQNFGPSGIPGETPDQPRLAWRPNGCVDQPTSLYLRWHNAAEAKMYSIQLATDSLFASLVLSDSTVTDTFKLVSALGHGVTYYWRVQALNIRGVSEWSTVWNFTTAANGAMEYHVSNSWNLVSLPLQFTDRRASTVYSSAISNPFGYNPTTGYGVEDTMNNGSGYWLKFREEEWIPLFGSLFTTDTLDVVEGWNLIGSISTLVPTNTVMSDPPGMVTSYFFGYTSSYSSSDVIEPGKGYWVKSNQAGRLILSASTASVSAESMIRIVATSDRPPPPPGETNTGDHASSIPQEFWLHQNYPNPFNPRTQIHYSIPKDGWVTLKVFNMMGQEVTTLVDEAQAQGSFEIDFDASGISSGIYFYRLQAGKFIETRKLVLLR